MEQRLQEDLDLYGFSQCVVVHKQVAVLSAAEPDLSHIDSNFLPAPMAPSMLSATTLSPDVDAAPAVFHYPRLGVS